MDRQNSSLEASLSIRDLGSSHLKAPGFSREGEKHQMIKMLEPMMSEIQQEAAITKRVLERVPADKLAWKPHPKSMSLGQLALHIATIPGNLSKLAQQEGFDLSAANLDPPAPGNAKEI